MLTTLKTVLALVLGGGLLLACVSSGFAEEEPLAKHRIKNCAGRWPSDINIVDANGQCVGKQIAVDPTVVARQIGDQIYSIEVTVRRGISKGLATFLYPTADCSGTAYMEDDDNLPQALWADLNGVLWTNGSPPSGGTIDVHSTRQAPAGACSSFNQAAVLVGQATAIDSSLVNSLSPPFGVLKPH